MFNPELKNYLLNLIELHDLQARGLGDSQAADDIRDAMDGPWYKMSERDTEISGHISALLNSLGRDDWSIALIIESGKWILTDPEGEEEVFDSYEDACYRATKILGAKFLKPTYYLTVFGDEDAKVEIRPDWTKRRSDGN